MKIFSYLLTLLFIITFSPNTIAAETEANLDISAITCPSANLLGPKLIKSVCWSGMFPLYLAGVKVKGNSKHAPSGRSKDLACACGGDLEKGKLPNIGTAIGLYLPKYLITVTKKPYCFPELNGMEFGSQIGLTSRYNIGNEDSTNIQGDQIENTSSFSWHLAAFPLTRMLELFDAPSCFLDGYSSFDLMWISETLPIWYDDELAFLIAPESIAFANPIAQSARIYDCVSSSLWAPSDKMFFSAGCWGSMYPLTQNQGTGDDKVAAKSLAATKALYLLSRIGMLDRTMGSDAVCRDKSMPVLKKSQFVMQQLWPMTEGDAMDIDCQDPSACNGDTTSTTGPSLGASEDANIAGLDSVIMNSLNSSCTHPIGQTTFNWGVWRDAQQSSFASYLLFQWNDCCLGVF
jgi:conjugal transfer pilus assembly protein TraU